MIEQGRCISSVGPERSDRSDNQGRRPHNCSLRRFAPRKTPQPYVLCLSVIRLAVGPSAWLLLDLHLYPRKSPYGDARYTRMLERGRYWESLPLW